ncbi:MAG TPA: hypothetical protein VH590_21130, partial [Ktedonobacterales bacterium]
MRAALGFVLASGWPPGTALQAKAGRNNFMNRLRLEVISVQPTNRQPSVGVGTAAPELEPTAWVNSQPFRLADVRGRVA